MSRLASIPSWLKPRIVVGAVLAAGFAATLAVNLPGQLSYDALNQLLDGRSHYYHSWHPPVMAWLLGLGDALVPGTALFVIADALLLFGALLSLLWLRPRPSYAAAAIAGLCIATPQLLLYEGIVWKDVLFANASVAGFVFLAWAGARWPRRRARFAWISAGFACLILATMTRQNGFVALAGGAAALIFIAARGGERPGKALAIGAAAFFLSLALALTASVALAAHGDRGEGAREEFKLLETYDLVGALTHDPSLALDGLRDPPFEKLLRGDGVRLYSPTRNDTLRFSPALQTALDQAPAGALFAAWRALIENHLWLYLQTRADIFRWVFLTPDIAQCVTIFTGVDSEPSDTLRALGMTARERPQDIALRHYAETFLGTPIFSHPAFALGALAALFLLFRRRTSSDIAIGFMLLGALGFTASFFFVSIACDYRYLYFLDLSTLAAFVYLALDFHPRAGRSP